MLQISSLLCFCCILFSALCFAKKLNIYRYLKLKFCTGVEPNLRQSVININSLSDKSKQYTAAVLILKIREFEDSKR